MAPKQTACLIRPERQTGSLRVLYADRKEDCELTSLTIALSSPPSDFLLKKSRFFAAMSGDID